MALSSRSTFIGLGKETTQGTPVPPTLFLPVEPNAKPQDTPTWIQDTSLQGRPAKLKAEYQGVLDASVDYGGMTYPDILGMHLQAMRMVDTVGSPRTVSDGVTTTGQATISSATAAWTQADVGGSITGTGIPAGTTILSVQSTTGATMSANATATGSAVSFTIGTTGQYRHLFTPTINQPTPYTITDFNAFSTRQYPGSLLDSLDFTIDVKQAIKFAAKWKGWPSVTTTKPTPAMPTSNSLLGWGIQVFIGGTQSKRLLSGSISLKGNEEPIHTASNQQGPYASFAGDLEAAVKMKLLFEDETDWTHIINNDQPALKVVMNNASGPVLTFTSSKLAWKTAPGDRSQKYMQIDVDADCVDNTTDGGPCQFLLVNSTTAAY